MIEVALAPFLPWIILSGISLGFFGIAAGIFSHWLRIKHGYPLENAWGKSVYPQRNDETVERVKLLSQENGQLRAELGAVKDRLANVERIVTDGANQLDREIDALRSRSN